MCMVRRAGVSGGLGRWSWASRGGRFPPHERLAGVSGTRGPGRGSLGLQGQGHSSCDQRVGGRMPDPQPPEGTSWTRGQHTLGRARGPVLGSGASVPCRGRSPGPTDLIQSPKCSVARGRPRKAPQLLSLTPIPSPVLLPPRHPLLPLVFGCLPLLPRPPTCPCCPAPGSLPSPAKGRGALGGPGVVGRMGRSQDRAEGLVGSAWGPGLLPHPVRVACDSARPAPGTASAWRNVHPSALLPEPWTRAGHPPVQQASLPASALARSPVLSGQHWTLWLLLSSCPGTWGPRAPGKNQLPRPQSFTSPHWFDSVSVLTLKICFLKTFTSSSAFCYRLYKILSEK